MKSALAGTLERARSTFSTISLGQKVVIGLLLVGLLLGGFFFFRWITAPTQAPLFSNLAAADASAIVDELNAAGVAYELTDGGQTIMVAKDAVYDLRLHDERQGPAGRPGHRLRAPRRAGHHHQRVPAAGRPTSGRSRASCPRPSSRSTASSSAVVHVALPEGRGLRDRAGQADRLGAARPRARHRRCRGEQIQAVTNLVSSSVQDMEPEQVTVADSDRPGALRRRRPA